MKNFFVLFAILIAVCISSFAQKKVAFDPCLSKDPKVRATSKKPCPSAPAQNKTKPVTPPKGTDDGETSDDNSDENSDDSPSNGKTSKKTNPPTKSKTPKPTDYLGTFFLIEILHNGEKTELANTQFEEGAGNASVEPSGRMNFFYGAGNSVKNDDDFMFTGMISAAEKGSFALGTSGVSFSFKADKFPNVLIFLCKSGSYDITAMPLAGGFVEGTFTANCIGEVHDDGSLEKYSMSGRFKLLRMM